MILVIKNIKNASKNSAIEQYLTIKHNNSTDQHSSSDVRKILSDNTIIIYKNDNKKKNGYEFKKQWA